MTNEISIQAGDLHITIAGPSGQWDARDLYTMAVVALIQDADTSFWQKLGNFDADESFYAAVFAAVARQYADGDVGAFAFGQRVSDVVTTLLKQLTDNGKLQQVLRRGDGTGLDDTDE